MLQLKMRICILCLMRGISSEVTGGLECLACAADCSRCCCGCEVGMGRGVMSVPVPAELSYFCTAKDHNLGI